MREVENIFRYVFQVSVLATFQLIEGKYVHIAYNPLNVKEDTSNVER